MFLAIQILQSFSSCKRLNFSSVLRSKENKHTMQVNIRNIIELFFFTHKDKVLFIWFKDHTFKRQKKLQEEGNQATAWNPLPPSPSHYSSQENTRREFSSLYSQELEIPIEFRICVSQSGTVLFMDFPLTTPKTCAEGARKAHWYCLNNLEGFFPQLKEWGCDFLPCLFSKCPCFKSFISCDTERINFALYTSSLLFQLPHLKTQTSNTLSCHSGTPCTASHKNHVCLHRKFFSPITSI